MFAKFVFVCLAALCAIQGFQGRSAEPHSVEPRSITGIINEILSILEKIKRAANISNILKELKIILDSIMEKIKEFDIGAIITSIQDKIDDILKNAGLDPTAARECNDAQKPAVERMANDAKDTFVGCANNYADSVKDVIANAEETKADIDAFETNVIASINTCNNEGGLDAIKTVKCLHGHLESIKQDADKLILQSLKTANAFKDVALEFPLVMPRCTAAVTKQVMAAEKKIIDDINQCIKDNKPSFVSM